MVSTPRGTGVLTGSYGPQSPGPGRETGLYGVLEAPVRGQRETGRSRTRGGETTVPAGSTPYERIR